MEYHKNHDVEVKSVGDAEIYGLVEGDIINRNLLLLIIKQLMIESKVLPIYKKIEGNKC